MLDTGCYQSVLRPQDIPEGVTPKGSQMALQCIHGDKKSDPLGEVTIKQGDGSVVPLRVGVVTRLPESMIIGNDYPDQENMINESQKKEETCLNIASFAQTEEEWTNPKVCKSRNQHGKEKHKVSKALPFQREDFIWESDRNFRMAQREETQFQEAWKRASEEEDPQVVDPHFINR
ncbi:hypothetical protein NDU88_008951 [Pleurodeles waltl]|uniref:Uncharacterized protein n=1 Tax=Pleurodeles waltl TaxID=8319 RepID=A0AAV7QW37_PLEWA|nr:hypothetical protein NDU88_008951 [Pleurodeles waltl]